MIFLILFSLFPSYTSEIIFNVLEKNFEIKVISDGKKFRIDLKGKNDEVYFIENDKIMVFQDKKWKEIKSPIYNENNFFLSVFIKNSENFQIDKEKDEDGLKKATISSSNWGKVNIKRIKINKMDEVPEGIFPKKSKFDFSKLKTLLKSEDEKEVSSTAGARGVGEEENIDSEPDYNALQEVEKIKVTKEEVEKFAKEGALK